MMRKILSFILACEFLLLLTSCSFFGHNYGDEEIISSLPADGEVAKELVDMIPMLSVNSPVLPNFKGATEAMKYCRDSVLYYMLMKSYGKYTGDIKKLDAAVEAYPHMQITSLIPAREFEETVYTAFGGRRKISNESGRLFVYLDKVGAYTAVTILDSDPVKCSVLSLAETENTYRMTVRCSLDGVTAPDYTVVFIKRDEGPAYIYSVE